MVILCSLFTQATILTSDKAFAAEDNLIEVVTAIESRLQGRVGVAIYDDNSGQSWLYHADDRFPLNSTFKTLICASLLARVDAGIEDLQRKIAFEESDLVSYSPVTEKRVGSDGMMLSEICEAAMTMSDNTAANLILDSIGGPAELTKFLRSFGDSITRLDRWETKLNETIPGDPRDTTTPNAMAETLRKLLFGDILSIQSREQLIDWLIGNRTSGHLIRAGVPDNWKVGDRTGAGNYGSRSIVAVIWPPERKPIIATIYITETQASFKERDEAIAQIGSAIFEAVR